MFLIQLTGVIMMKSMLLCTDADDMNYKDS